ncbi:MAG TPA: histidine kinase [Steroidobacteraceae bacterium]|nr:histidine kinase [Steroidobacteraceae bacterium]
MAPANNNRALFALWGLFWLLMMAVAIEDERNSPSIKWWEPVLWEGSSCIVATCWLALQRRVSKRWNENLDHPLRWFGKHLAWLPLLIPSFVVAVYAMRHAVYAMTGEIYEHESWGFVLFYESIKLLLFTSLWLCIIFGFASFNLWRQERERLLALQKHLAESQLAQLKAQLQPHFLFNALNTISALMQVDVERADRLLTRLADLLRSSLQAGARHMTSLREELKLLELYEQIMEERFAGRVELIWNIADDALDAAVPAMLLQPVLENAFKHGVERSRVPVTIRIDANRHDDVLQVKIRNSGATLAATPGMGIGLRNCRERLDLIYGQRASLELAQDGDGVAARLTIPCTHE